MATHVKANRPEGEPARRGYHMPGIDPVNVYSHRDIPHGWDAKWRDTVGHLITGPKDKTRLATLLGFPMRGPASRHRASRVDTTLRAITDRVATLCEGRDGTVGLVTPDGRGLIGGPAVADDDPHTLRQELARQRRLC